MSADIAAAAAGSAGAAAAAAAGPAADPAAGSAVVAAAATGSAASSVAVCPLCPHHCRLAAGRYGLCRARRNEGGRIVCANYGKLTSIALDPIEKKPFARFHPGSTVFSIGSYGCNMRCPFCQNSDISQVDADELVRKGFSPQVLSPEQVVEYALAARGRGNIGVAYTYNEPLVSYEFVTDCARLVHEAGMQNVLVSNGNICEEPFAALLPLIDADNIDLKGFTEGFYRECGGDLATVKRSIELAAACPTCHLEVTTLLVPGRNDSEDEIAQMASWLASIDDTIPYHLSRFFPRYHMMDTRATDVREVHARAELARKYLKYVYVGNC